MSPENEQDQICADCETAWSANMDIRLFDNHFISEEDNERNKAALRLAGRYPENGFFDNHFISEEDNEWNKAALRLAGRYPENGFDEDKNSPVLGDAYHISPKDNQRNHLLITWASEQKKITLVGGSPAKPIPWCKRLFHKQRL